MKTFQLTLFEGHPIIHDGKNRILIDTGCLNTIHIANQFNFLDRNYNVTTNYGGTAIPGFCDLIGTPITTLLGADIIRDFIIVFDYRNGSVSFSTDPVNDFGGTTVNFTIAISVPVLDLVINNQEARCLLDTGAKFSYIKESYTLNRKSDGIGADFFIGLGKYERPYFSMESNFREHILNVRYLTPPQPVLTALNSLRVDGIVGYDFMNNFRILLNLAGESLSYLK